MWSHNMYIFWNLEFSELDLIFKDLYLVIGYIGKVNMLPGPLSMGMQSTMSLSLLTS